MCDVCGSTSGKTVLQATDHREGLGGSFELLECLSCHLVRTEPRPDDLSSWYPPEYANHTARPPLTVRAIGRALRYNARPIRNERIARLLGWALPNAEIGPPLAQQARVLDVGAGNGSAVAALRAAGAEAWGVEPSAVGVDAAHANGIDTVIQGTLESAPLPEGPWDVIRFTHVLEHVPSPVATLRFAQSALAKDGRIVILVPNFGGIGRRIFGRAWDGLEVPRHLHHFTPSTLRKTLAAAGLAPLTVRTVALFGVLPASIDAWSSGGQRQRGWGGSLAVRAGLYPLELATALVGVGDGIAVIATRMEAGNQPAEPYTHRAAT